MPIAYGFDALSGGWMGCNFSSLEKERCVILMVIRRDIKGLYP